MSQSHSRNALSQWQPPGHVLSDPGAPSSVEALDLFALLRQIDARNPSERLGRSHTAREDTVRLGQQPSTLFAPSTLYSLESDTVSRRTRIKILSFGVFGPNGGLPLHMTEHLRERQHHHGDRAPVDFVNLFQHRFISLFYRAWADAQSVVQLDRPGLGNFSFYAGSLIGMGLDASWNRDSVDDSAKLRAAGHLVRQTRNPEGLQRLISHFFGVPCRLMEFIRSFIVISPQDQTRLSLTGQHNRLGVNAIAGSQVPDVQSRFRLLLGALTLRQFECFLPPARGNRQLRDWVRNYIGIEMDWDVQLLLRAEEVPPCHLGASTQLGWTTWLGQRSHSEPANELRLNPERDAERFSRG
ncbi:type VI secretion system baseplate subunit TssG [Diaphorobacter sp.]|uniref:type VI secretion system baseplate subunit TssG n=1 Tax=Diaphorobacter sp. TaxID=1934310 RepID=UPI0028ACA3A2|nr:type VI secretion system baseplate subunit TssG [Diaphorobacter sp.]